MRKGGDNSTRTIEGIFGGAVHWGTVAKYTILLISEIYLRKSNKIWTKYIP